MEREGKIYNKVQKLETALNFWDFSGNPGSKQKVFRF